MEGFLNDVKSIIIKIKAWKRKRNLEKEKKLLARIDEEYPSLTASYFGQKEPPRQNIIDYHKIKSIKSQRINNWIMVFLTAVIIVLTYTNLKVVLNSSQPLAPSISLYIPETFGQITEISSQVLIEKRFLPGKSMDLCIKNEGQTETGRITNFDSIDSGKSGCANENIRQKDTSSDKDGNISQVPIGKVNLNFEVVCNNCEPRIFKKTLEVCIWSNNSTICRN